MSALEYTSCSPGMIKSNLCVGDVFERISSHAWFLSWDVTKNFVKYFPVTSIKTAVYFIFLLMLGQSTTGDIRPLFPRDGMACVESQPILRAFQPRKYHPRSDQWHTRGGSVVQRLSIAIRSFFSFKKVVGSQGIEPWAYGLKVRRSTYWAKNPKW